MPKRGMTLQGVREMTAKLRKLQNKLPDEVGRALYQEANVEATECKMRTPVETGNLRASIYVRGPVREGKKIVVWIVAGGVAAPYAIYVHEDLWAHHPVGQAKFIESVIRESKPYIAARVARRIDLNRATS